MAIILLIILVFALIFCIIFFVSNHLKVKEMITNFKKCNVIVFGKKGTGKDLIFQKVINSRKDTYYSNISYGGDYKDIEVRELTTGNTYNDFIQNKINLCNKVNEREGKDIYLSDCGIILPSQYDSTLHKVFPSFSSYYALSRHLYNSNVHCNTQALSRVWKALREQADYYINTLGTKKIFGLLITKCVSYDRYSSAEKSLTPFKPAKGLNDRTSTEMYREFESINGEVKSFYVIQRVKRIRYDTRAYHEKIFGITFENWLSSQKEQVKEQESNANDTP